MYPRLLVFFLLSALLPASLFAAVIRVPADQPTIQAGIDASSDGDTVLVANGVYTGPGNWNIKFYGKAITLRSENGPEGCIIDGVETYHRGFLFQNGEGADSVLSGITVRNCRAGWPGGGGIYCEDSAPNISNCIITGNVNTDGYGGGIYADHATPVIVDCIIENNESEMSGGGIACRYGSAPVIRGNIIRGNTAHFPQGGGMHINAPNAIIEDNLVEGNQGGGIWFQESDLVITGNTITGNSEGGVVIWGGHVDLVDNEFSGNSSGRGAGVRGYGGRISMSDCRIVDNLCVQSYEYGAGMTFEDCSSIHIDNCLIAGNSFADDNGAGGGMFVYNGSIFITNTTISDNEAHWGGPFGNQAEYLELTDCIIWGNSTIDFYTVTGYPEPVFDHCDVQGGWPGTGNLDADPLFASGPGGAYYLSQQAAGQAADSPCLDSGSGLAADICYQVLETTRCMDQFTTRTDQLVDAGQVDMGYHHRTGIVAGEPFVIIGPGPGQGNPPLIRLFPPEEGAAHTGEFYAYGTIGYGVNVACGDLDGDGLAEILTGAGPGAIYGPHVRGFTVDGTQLPGLSFLAYGTQKYGINVTAADLDGDGLDEIVTGAGPGAVFGPHVRGFADTGDAVTPLPGVSYFAYGTLKWGVNVAGGDIDGDGNDEIVTGAGPGTVFGPHVRGWNVDNGTVSAMAGVSWFAYGTARHGVRVACGDVDGDGIDEILTAPGPALEFASHIRGWNHDGQGISELPGYSFLAWGATLPRYGARVAADVDLDGDDRHELVVGAGPDPSVGSPVRVFTYDGAAVSPWFSLQAYHPGTTHGVNVASGRFAD